MDELVKIIKNDIFTDSLIIAGESENEHKSVTALIKKYLTDFEEFGIVGFSDLKSKNPKGGRSTRIYLLNEQQPTEGGNGKVWIW